MNRSKGTRKGCVAVSLAFRAVSCQPRAMRFGCRRRPGRIDPEWAAIGPALAPSKGEFRSMLADLRRVWPTRREFGAVLGVSSRTIRAWEAGENASDGARRAVWLTWALIFHPARLQTVFDLATWGRFRPAEEPRRRKRDDFGEVVSDWSI